MWSGIEPLLSRFRPCFSRSRNFCWFLLIISGFIIRLDQLGASSFIRWRFLNLDCYELMLRFFRASSWSLPNLLSVWTGICVDLFPVIEINRTEIADRRHHQSEQGSPEDAGSQNPPTRVGKQWKAGVHSRASFRICKSPCRLS